MTNNSYTKEGKGKKILVIISSLILLAVLAAAYLYFPSSVKFNGPESVATSTPDSSPELGLFITPKTVQQGEPVLITVNGVTSISKVKSLTLGNLPFFMFIHDGKVTALKGIDLNADIGTFPVILTLKNGKQLRQNIVITKREIVRKRFDIPQKLGGNTPEGERELFLSLGQEAKIINKIPTSKEKYWTEKFGSPLKGPLVVADPYGYTRLTVNSSMPHKGTDLQAPMNTPVYAMNRGVVRFTENLRNYGNAIFIDHGAGVQTVYMHLSKINVIDGQMVEKGDPIGLSGDTGYTLDPHLHLTVRIWEISIDPMKFLEILGLEN